MTIIYSVKGVKNASLRETAGKRVNRVFCGGVGDSVFIIICGFQISSPCLYSVNEYVILIVIIG